MNVETQKTSDLAAMGPASANVHKEGRELNSPPEGGCSRH